MERNIIPDVVQEQDICSLSDTASAFEAACAMETKNVAAVVVVNADGGILGIVTERDLSRRVMAKDLNAKETSLGEIMTKNPDTLAPDDTAADALELMRTRSYRHLPVTRDGKVVGMVSIRDLYAAIKSDLEKDIRETEAFVFGDRYGA